MRAEMEAALENRDARAAAGKAVGDSGAADPRADDRHINCVGQVTHSSDRRGACCSLYLKQPREAVRKGQPQRAAAVGRFGPTEVGAGTAGIGAKPEPMFESGVSGVESYPVLSEKEGRSIGDSRSR